MRESDRSHGSIEEKRFCPNCGSTDVEPDFSNSGFVGEAGGNPNAWSCGDCNYTGLMPSGDPENSSKDGEEIEFDPGETYPREDISLGRGYLKYLLYILLPLLIVYALARLTG